MTTAPNWQVNLFGRLSVQRGECNITNFRTAKVGLLLAVLAQGQDRAIRRDDLADRLWPDQPPEIGQNRLRVALSYLRDILEPVPDERGTVLLADRREVRLAPGAITIDTAEFEATLLKADLIEDVADRCAALESAIGKYHAQFLPEFDDVWVTTERERLSEVYQLALRRLIHVLISIKEFDRAVAIAEQAVQIDPCLEEAHRLLMLTYAKMGRPAASVRQYETLQRMLMARTESEPSIETREALDTISNRAQPPHRTGPRVARTTKRVRAKANPESRIPLQLTPLIGRDDCVSRILVMLKTPQTRLVNITGIAGVGKSRLAIAVAEELRSRGQAVMYLSLLGADGSESIVGQLASAGRTPSSPRATLLTRLTLALERRNVLIVLDNVEHLLAAASDVMRNVLQSCPGITFLITSRHRIGMAGEYNFPLRPLPTPSAQSDAAEIATSPSVRLWLDRVRAARPSFQLNDANCGDVAAVCSTLDGIPLAIELAAAWADVLTPRQIRGRLNRRFDVLVGRDPHMDRRHASLLAALDWSFDQLPSRTQRFFLRLGRFSCGWTLEAAEAVCDEPQAMGLIAQLIDRSLVTAEETEFGARFAFLGTIREHALKRIDAESLREATREYVRYFAALSREAGEALSSGNAAHSMRRIKAEDENIREALDAGIEEPGAGEEMLTACTALYRYWRLDGAVAEGRSLLGRALGSSPGRSETHARALGALGHLCCADGDYASAEPHYAESREIYAALGDKRGEAAMCSNSANARRGLRDLDGALELAMHGLALLNQLGDATAQARALGNLSVIACDRGEYTDAQHYGEQALGRFRRSKDYPSVIAALLNTAYAALQLKRWQYSAEMLSECLDLCTHLRASRLLGMALTSAGVYCRHAGAQRTAIQLMAAGAEIWRRLHLTLSAERDELIELRQELGSAVVDAEWEIGRKLSTKAAVSLAKSTLPHSQRAA